MAQTKTVLDQRTVVHITSQGKGGVFKSGASALLGQYLQEKGHEVKLFDTDPTNATLSHFEGLNVAHVNVTDGNAVDIRKFNEIANRIVTEDGPFVIDTGATIFLPFWDYVGQSQLIEFFAEQRRRVVIHCPVMGGQELSETVKGLAAICRMMPAESIVVWLNGFHGSVENEGKPFEDFAVVRENADRLLGIVRLGDAIGTLRGRALQSLAEKNRTFREAMGDSSIGLIERHVLHQVRRGLWEQLEAIF
jgi:hypothetical protein